MKHNKANHNETLHRVLYLNMYLTTQALVSVLQRWLISQQLEPGRQLCAARTLANTSLKALCWLALPTLQSEEICRVKKSG